MVYVEKYEIEVTKMGQNYSFFLTVLSYSEAYCIHVFLTGTYYLRSRTESTAEILFVYFIKP